jgi:hypothetical protein
MKWARNPERETRGSQRLEQIKEIPMLEEFNSWRMKIPTGIGENRDVGIQTD